MIYFIFMFHYTKNSDLEINKTSVGGTRQEEFLTSFSKRARKQFKFYGPWLILREAQGTEKNFQNNVSTTINNFM